MDGEGAARLDGVPNLGVGHAPYKPLPSSRGPKYHINTRTHILVERPNMREGPESMFGRILACLCGLLEPYLGLSSKVHKRRVQDRALQQTGTDVYNRIADTLLLTVFGTPICKAVKPLKR